VLVSHNTDRVLAGFTALTDEERKAAIRLLNEYISADVMRKRALRDGYNLRGSLERDATTGASCPCCGR
jgi:hypothetical protein